MERLLLQSEKLAATGRMAATIAHEINNPLESVMNLIYLAGRSCPEGSEAHNLLHTAEKRGRTRLSHRTADTWAITANHGMPAAVYLHDLIEDVSQGLSSKFYARGIQVERVFEKCRPVIVSKGELVQVFSNIIANSVDAMQHGGVLRVQIAETPGGEGRPGSHSGPRHWHRAGTSRQNLRAVSLPPNPMPAPALACGSPGSWSRTAEAASR